MKSTCIVIFFLVAPSICIALENKIDFVLVSKEKHHLQLFAKGKIIKTYHVVFGANPNGHKEREGDERTPEGKYILDYKKEDSSFHRAMHISYPNKRDIEIAKLKGVNPGGQIMIHGQKNGLGWAAWLTKHFNWTNGCIAVANSDMNEIWSLVDIGTPIEIKK